MTQEETYQGFRLPDLNVTGSLWEARRAKEKKRAREVANAVRGGRDAFARDVVGYIPGVGDALFVKDIYDNARSGNLPTAAAMLAMMFLPKAVSKMAAPLVKGAARTAARAGLKGVASNTVRSGAAKKALQEGFAERASVARMERDLPANTAISRMGDEVRASARRPMLPEGGKPPVAIPALSQETRDFIDRFNEFVRFYGYDKQKKSRLIDVKKAEKDPSYIYKQANKLALQHNTFTRGADSPSDVAKGRGYPELKWAVDAALAPEYEKGTLPTTPEDIEHYNGARYALNHYQGIGNVGGKMGIQKKGTPTIYTSNSRSLAAGYTTHGFDSSDPNHGVIGIVRRKNTWKGIDPVKEPGRWISEVNFPFDDSGLSRYYAEKYWPAFFKTGAKDKDLRNYIKANVPEYMPYYSFEALRNAILDPKLNLKGLVPGIKESTDMRDAAYSFVNRLRKDNPELKIGFISRKASPDKFRSIIEWFAAYKDLFDGTKLNPDKIRNMENNGEYRHMISSAIGLKNSKLPFAATSWNFDDNGIYGSVPGLDGEKIDFRMTYDDLADGIKKFLSRRFNTNHVSRDYNGQYKYIYNKLNNEFWPHAENTRIFTTESIYHFPDTKNPYQHFIFIGDKQGDEGLDLIKSETYKPFWEKLIDWENPRQHGGKVYTPGLSRKTLKLGGRIRP